jgi:uncharacterized protein (DUF433 family)
MMKQIKTWQIVQGKLELLDSTLAEAGRREPYDLESWIASNPEIVGPDLVIVGRQVSTQSGPLDLLAVDRGGNTVIIELKRDMLPREALAQAIDYASDVADWSIDKISEVCVRHNDKSLEDLLSTKFPDINLENLNVNETQRIVLVGFAMESSLGRMLTWLSDHYGVSVNAVLLKYSKTKGGDELLIRTSLISEEVEQQRISKKKFKIPMSDEPGEYELADLRELLLQYFRQDLYSARRIQRVLLPVCLERGVVTRDQLKDEFVARGAADSIRDAGYFLSLISLQVGLKKNDYLRQVIGYDYPNNPWEKDNYRIRDEYRDLVSQVLRELEASDE